LFCCVSGAGTGKRHFAAGQAGKQLALLLFELLHHLSRRLEGVAVAHLEALGQRRRPPALIIGTAAVEIGLGQRLNLGRLRLAARIDENDLQRRVARAHAQKLGVDEPHGEHRRMQTDGHGKRAGQHLVSKQPAKE
jgi:hypothetical protein